MVVLNINISLKKKYDGYKSFHIAFEHIARSFEPMDQSNDKIELGVLSFHMA